MKLSLIIPMLFILFTGCQMSQYQAKPPASINFPKNVMFIAQSGTRDHLFQTVIDLSNNELVVLAYTNVRLYRVFRTGMFVNPDDYKFSGIISTDAPYFTEENKEEKKEEEKKKEEEEKDDKKE